MISTSVTKTKSFYTVKHETDKNKGYGDILCRLPHRVTTLKC